MSTLHYYGGVMDHIVSRSVPGRHGDRTAPHSPLQLQHVIGATRLTGSARRRVRVATAEDAINAHPVQQHRDTTIAADYPPSSAWARSSSARIYPIA